MKVLAAFLVGIGIGVWGFFHYLKDKIPVSMVLSLKTDSENTTPTATIPPTPTIFDEESLFPKSPTPIPTEIPALISPPIDTPTQISIKKLTPTKKPTATPTRITPSITTSPNTQESSTPTITQALVTATVTPTSGISESSYRTYNPGEIYGFFDRFGGQYGVDPNVLRHIAKCESNFNPLAKSRNGLYGGLYQFSVGAWSTYRQKIGEDSNPNLRFDAEESIQTAAYILSIGMGSIWPNCLP